MDPNELEQVTGRALRRLPRPRAPHTLVARVMRAVQAADSRPWYARPWLTWPVQWQLASACVAIVGLAGALLGIGPGLEMVSPGLAPVMAEAFADISRVIEPAVSAARGAGAVWRALVEPLAYVAVVPVLMMFIATVVFGAALSRLAFGGPSQS